ncbi:hypothetical protein [Kribbella ginsengisoli]|uniref:Uncharacterized protein n=1 Tax=Kribbella ginsengisoli TaxID=363865 RepID=A0ABP6WNW9_9ACTN
MKLQRLALAVAGAGMLAATAASGPALAATQGEPTPSWAKSAAQQPSAKAVAEACVNTVIWPTVAGTVGVAEVTAAKPPRADQYVPFNFAADVRSMTTWYLASNSSGTQDFAYGLFLQNGNLMRHTTVFPDEGDPRVTTTKVGAGWTAFKAVATSNYNVAAPVHSYLYGLNTDGKLYRYAKNGTGYKNLGNFGGFAAFKTLTVISETPTYDTLLMTTKAGALYTIHIPITAAAKPVVKVIQASGWSAFESLVTQRCGVRGGTLVVGIDHDTNTGYQYAFGKANGKATVITSYGKVPATFDGVSHVAATWYKDQLIGE